MRSSGRLQPQRPPCDRLEPGQALGLAFVYLVLIVALATVVILGVMTAWHRHLI